MHCGSGMGAAAAVALDADVPHLAPAGDAIIPSHARVLEGNTELVQRFRIRQPGHSQPAVLLKRLNRNLSPLTELAVYDAVAIAARIERKLDAHVELGDFRESRIGLSRLRRR